MVSSSSVHTKWNPWTCSAKINQKHPEQNICKMVGRRQLFSDHWVKCWTTGAKQSWWTQSNMIHSNSKSASLCLIWSHWHLVQILYAFVYEYYHIIVPWLHFFHFVGMNYTSFVLNRVVLEDSSQALIRHFQMGSINRCCN